MSRIVAAALARAARQARFAPPVLDGQRPGHGSAPRSRMAFFVATDVGGTFTHLCVADATAATRVFKTSTTGDVMGGVLNALNLAAQSYRLEFGAFCARIERFGHGTTVSLNALLTGRAARTAVVTTA